MSVRIRPEMEKPLAEGQAIVAAMKAWLESDEGAQCQEGTAFGKYLKHRLESAFLAGYAAAEKNHPTYSSRKP